MKLKKYKQFNHINELKFSNINQLQKEFLELKNKWIEEVGYQSNPNILYSDVNYRRIVSFGKRIVPILFEDIKQHGGDWFTALVEIFKFDPVNCDNQGNIELMTQDWQKYLESTHVI